MKTSVQIWTIVILLLLTLNLKQFEKVKGGVQLRNQLQIV